MSSELRRLMRKSPAKRVRDYKRSGRMFAAAWGSYSPCPQCQWPVRDGRSHCLNCDAPQVKD